MAGSTAPTIANNRTINMGDLSGFGGRSTGFIVESEADAVAAIGRARHLDRGRIRKTFERRFSIRASRKSRSLGRPEFFIVDGAPGLEKAIAAVWDGVPVQRCTVHKHRNLLAHAPERLHEEITADYTDMIYAATHEEIEARRKASSASGGSSIVPLSTALSKPATASSPSPARRRWGRTSAFGGRAVV
jgi:hypothetical protein